MPDQDPYAPNMAPPNPVTFQEKRGMDAAVIALITKLHEDFVDTHGHVHETFVDAHTREHELNDTTHERTLSAMKKFMDERDRRYEEKWTASEKAVQTAVQSVEKKTDAAFTSSEKAIAVAAISIEKRADATYVQVGQLQAQLTLLMPRGEAEQRLISLEKENTELRDRVKGLEALKQGSKDAFTNVQMFLGIILALVTLGGVLFAVQIGGS